MIIIEGEIVMRIIVYVITAIAAFIFILVFAMMFSPKLRGKMMSKQVKSMKYMMDESKDDIQSISTNMADATKDGIETTTRAIKKGFTEEDSIYCKYCGAKIDKDSKFCKSCGKEQ
jgi:hypothetical protein